MRNEDMVRIPHLENGIGSLLDMPRYTAERLLRQLQAGEWSELAGKLVVALASAGRADPWRLLVQALITRDALTDRVRSAGPPGDVRVTGSVKCRARAHSIMVTTHAWEAKEPRYLRTLLGWLDGFDAAARFEVDLSEHIDGPEDMKPAGADEFQRVADAITLDDLRGAWFREHEGSAVVVVPMEDRDVDMRLHLFVRVVVAKQLAGVVNCTFVMEDGAEEKD